MERVPERGELEELALPRLLLGLHRAGYTGALELRRGRTEKRFLLQQGAPVLSESNLGSETLAAQLAERGTLPRAACDRAAARARESGGAEGAVFLELGLLEPKQLFDALRAQLCTRLLECFAWPAGSFRLDPATRPPADAQAFRIDVLLLLRDGLRTHWSSDRILMELSQRMELAPKPTSSFAASLSRLDPEAALAPVVARFDGAQTLWQALGGTSDAAALAAVWVLDAAGALDWQEPGVTSAEDEETPDARVEIVLSRGTARERVPKRKDAREPKAPAPDARIAALEREIREKYAHLDELDPYAVLGVGQTADATAIKRAYLQAAKTYHPDALARRGLDAAVREQASRVFARIGKAHAVLADPERRRDYDLTVTHDATADDAQRLAQAETLFRKGEILLRSGNFRGAIEFLAPAVELWPDECAYRSALGWALFRKSPPATESALAHLQAAHRLDPNDVETASRLRTVANATHGGG